VGLSRNQIIAASNRSLTPSLSNLGYELIVESGVDEHGLIFLYMKEPGSTDSLYRLFSLQPSGLDVNDLFDLAVNLSRWTSRSGPGPEKDHYPRQIANVRLAPCLSEMGEAMDYWWHFISEDELHNVCEDILDKIIKYGIPFLEDPESSFETFGTRWVQVRNCHKRNNKYPFAYSLIAYEKGINSQTIIYKY
jgi:hypothetical protein